jgi:hypothetical protein
LATNFKVLGQSAPGATTWATLYGPGPGVEAVVSTITIANRSSTAKNYRIALRLNNATLANEHYLAYNVTVAGSDTTALTLGITMTNADKLDVYASSADLTFQAFGSEIS